MLRVRINRTIHQSAANIEEGGRGNNVLSNRGAGRVSESGTPFLGIVKSVFDNRKANLFLASGEIWMTKGVRTIGCKLVYISRECWKLGSVL
jgi:hypothetical protein